jgi:hypothetical protein
VEDDKLDSIVKNIVARLKPLINDNDESNEEKKKLLDTIERIEESSSDIDEQQEENNNDKETILSDFIHINQDKFSEYSDEN